MPSLSLTDVPLVNPQEWWGLPSALFFFLFLFFLCRQVAHQRGHFDVSNRPTTNNNGDFQFSRRVCAPGSRSPVDRYRWKSENSPPPLFFFMTIIWDDIDKKEKKKAFTFFNLILAFWYRTSLRWIGEVSWPGPWVTSRLFHWRNQQQQQLSNSSCWLRLTVTGSRWNANRPINDSSGLSRNLGYRNQRYYISMIDQCEINKGRDYRERERLRVHAHTTPKRRR